MKPLDTLQADAILELAREGGVSFMPRLNGPRRIALDHFSDERRQQICQLINQTLPYAQPPAQAGRGDQRYFRVEIRGKRSLILVIPEAQVPSELVDLWRGGGG
jgi:hypothetical protein